MNKRRVELSSKSSATIEDAPIADIDRDPLFLELFFKAREYTMTSKEVMYSLYQAARYVSMRRIPGDFVECGVWRGGSTLLAGLTFKNVEETNKRSVFSPNPVRKLWLYDTYEGMTKPTELDVDIWGGSASNYIQTLGDERGWCYASLEDVQNTLVNNGFTNEEFELVKGDVLQTLRHKLPKEISVLRLDTDWYESTKIELEILYPRLSRGGVLIIDDYGHWEGSRRAVDEYFCKHPSPLFQRTSYAVRTAVKI